MWYFLFRLQDVSKSPGQYRYLYSQYTKAVDAVHYLGLTLNMQLTCLTYINQVKRRAAQRLGTLGPLLNRSGMSIRNNVLLYEQLIHLLMDYLVVHCPHPHQESASVTIQVS
jgi:hypothetical protein